MKTLQISKQDAVKLYVKASPEIKVIFENTFGKESFSNKITDRIQSFDDVLECLNINDLLLPFRNPITQEEKSINAMLKLLKIVEAYNEGTVLNWKDTSQYKHWPYKYCFGGDWSVGCVFWYYVACCPAGLTFKSSELALDAFKKFEDIFDDYIMFKR